MAVRFACHVTRVEGGGFHFNHWLFLFLSLLSLKPSCECQIGNDGQEDGWHSF